MRFGIAFKGKMLYDCHVPLTGTGPVALTIDPTWVMLGARIRPGIINLYLPFVDFIYEYWMVGPRPDDVRERTVPTNG